MRYVAELIIRKFYVDNYLDSFDTVEEGTTTCRRLRELLFLGGFVLGQLAASSRTILQSVPATERAKPDLNVDLDALPVHRTLGLEWNAESDDFFFTLLVPTATTKRQVLSAVSGIYDPMGFLAAVTITAKILLQDMWRVGKDVEPDGRRPAKLGWGHPLPSVLQHRWDSFARSLEALRGLRIPRCLRPVQFQVGDTRFQIHLFCDASPLAMGANLFLRCECRGEVAMRLMAARSRVAPVEQQTLTRLELMAALLGARLLKRYMHHVKAEAVWCWSDSDNVLYWLRSEATLYSPFISSRKEQILAVTPSAYWRHVPTALNPADDLSRGIEASEPPTVCELIGAATSLSELKRAVAELTAAPGEALTPAALRAGLNCCVKVAQKSVFASELRRLSQGRQICRRSPLRKLSPFLDPDGLLRVGGALITPR